MNGVPHEMHLGFVAGGASSGIAKYSASHSGAGQVNFRGVSIFEFCIGDTWPAKSIRSELHGNSLLISTLACRVLRQSI
jgi:hypothetical protein